MLSYVYQFHKTYAEEIKYIQGMHLNIKYAPKVKLRVRFNHIFKFRILIKFYSSDRL